MLLCLIISDEWSKSYIPCLLTGDEKIVVIKGLGQTFDDDGVN